MNTPSSGTHRQPEFPTPKELEVLYPLLAEREKLLQQASRVYIAQTMEGKEADKDGLIQVYLNYCKAVEKSLPLYAEQAKMAFNYIENHAKHIMSDINDNHGHLRQLYPFLGPLVTTIRNR